MVRHPPGGPATLDDDGPLETSADELPYLLKVLAAAEPLSLQTHPTPAQAHDGFDREEAAGIRSTRRSGSTATRPPSRSCCVRSHHSRRCAASDHSTQTLAWFVDEGWTQLADGCGDGPAAYVRWP